MFFFFFEDEQNNTFEELKQINEFSNKFWYARDLQKALEYSQWKNFNNVIEKAKIACENSEINIDDHFADVSKMVELGSGASREIDDMMLSRYACYLIVQNGDPRKEVIAYGQTYFAVQTCKQEIQEEFKALDEDRKRLAIRNELKQHNSRLADAAHDAGVEQGRDAIFQNKGYQGLYGGLGAKEIHARKNLIKSQKI